MRLHLRVETRIGLPHTTFRVFVDGASCGLLTMSTEEFAIFEDIIQQGCTVRDCGDELQVTRPPER